MEELKEKLLQLCVHQYASERLDYDTHFQSITDEVIKLLEIDSEKVDSMIDKETVRLMSEAGEDEDYIKEILSWYRKDK